eukprot:8334206-Ditylum_brightwellii.AAC.1
MKGKQIKKIPNNDAIIPLHGDSLLRMVSLPLAIPVSYMHRLQSGKVSNKDLRKKMMYLTAKGFNCVKMACCQLLLSWKIAMRIKLSSPTLNNNLILPRTQTFIHGYKILIRLIPTQLCHQKQASPCKPPRACNLWHLSRTHRLPLQALLLMEEWLAIRYGVQRWTQAALHLALLCLLSPDFENILQASGLKNDSAWMLAETLSNFYEEVAYSTHDFLFKITFPPHIGNFFCNLSLEMCLKKTPMSEDKSFLDKE